jgi:CheY-like chemotaxis protein
VTTVLILDDQATNRTVYARLARAIAEDIVVETFADAAEALEWLEYGRADLILTDFKMPGMDGAAFTRRLRALPHGHRIPVIVVTAHDDRAFRVRALDAGATDFLQSPIDPFELVTRARNLLALGERWENEAASAPAAPRAPAAPGGTANTASLEGAILDALPALVSAVDRNGLCIYANARLAAAHGVARADLLGLGLATRLDPERLARSRQEERRVFDLAADLPPCEVEPPAGAPAGTRLVTARTALRDSTGAVTAVLTITVEIPPSPAAPPGGSDGTGA